MKTLIMRDQLRVLLLYSGNLIRGQRHQYGIFGRESKTSLFTFRVVAGANERRLYSQARYESVFVLNPDGGNSPRTTGDSRT